MCWMSGWVVACCVRGAEERDLLISSSTRRSRSSLPPSSTRSSRAARKHLQSPYYCSGSLRARPCASWIAGCGGPPRRPFPAAPARRSTRPGVSRALLPTPVFAT